MTMFAWGWMAGIVAGPWLNLAGQKLADRWTAPQRAIVWVGRKIMRVKP